MTLNADAFVAALETELLGDTDAAETLASILNARANFWDIVDYGDLAGEIRYSKFLAWLLDPRESHGLGPRFANNVAKLLTWDSEGAQFSPAAHTHCERMHVDVAVYDETTSTAVIIENKTVTDEHFAGASEAWQTERYLDVNVPELIDGFHSYRHTGFVYLTPYEGARGNAQDPRWQSLRYRELNKALDDAAENAEPHAAKIINDFRHSTTRRFATKFRDAIERLYFGSSDEKRTARTARANERFALELAALASSDASTEDGTANAYFANLRNRLVKMEEVEPFLAAAAPRIEAMLRTLVPTPALHPLMLERFIKAVWVTHRPTVLAQDQTKDPAIIEMVASLREHLRRELEIAGLGAVVDIPGNQPQMIELRTAEAVQKGRYENDDSRIYWFGVYEFAASRGQLRLHFRDTERNWDYFWPATTWSEWTSNDDSGDPVAALARNIAESIRQHSSASVLT